MTSQKPGISWPGCGVSLTFSSRYTYSVLDTDHVGELWRHIKRKPFLESDWEKGNWYRQKHKHTYVGPSSEIWDLRPQLREPSSHVLTCARQVSTWSHNLQMKCVIVAYVPPYWSSSRFNGPIWHLSYDLMMTCMCRRQEEAPKCTYYRYMSLLSIDYSTGVVSCRVVQS